MKRTGFAFVISLLLLAHTFAFAQVHTGGIAAPALGLIKGKVTDTQTPRPNNLVGATVTVESMFLDTRTATTDAAGNYEILNLPPGEYFVTVSKPGYDKAIGYVTVVPGGIAFHDFRLYRTDTLMSYYWKMGPFRRPLLLCFLFLLLSIPIAVVHINRDFRRLVRLESEIGEASMSRVRKALQSDDMLGAISICDEVGGLANILKAGLLRYAELSGKGEAAGGGIQQVIWKEKVQEAIEEAGVAAKRELEFHWSLFAMFGFIGGMAALFGSLGTVAGTYRAFKAVYLKGTGDPQQLIGGISEALLTTWFGLFIVIASAFLCLIVFIVHGRYKKKANALISGAQRTFAEMFNLLFAA